MKFIKDLKPGDRIADIYMCKHKQSATTKNGKEYFSVILQDKTGCVDAKIWEPGGAGIEEFDPTDCVDVFGEVTSYNGALQVNIKRARKCAEGEFDLSNYLPVSSKDNEGMYKELLGIIETITNPYLKKLLEDFFINDKAFIELFRKSSAAKTVHHGFIGGLLEHTLSVTKLCNYMAGAYPALNRDLLLTAAMCHDIGKTKELSLFPINDYTDEGQFLGHIVMGCEMVGEKARAIDGFPELLKQQLQHCILAHHGEFEYGSPKKPAIMEAVALNLADNTDAKMETFTELLANALNPGWQGFNKFFETNIYQTKVD